MADGFTTSLLCGLAVILDGAGVALYDPTGGDEAAGVAAVIGDLPQSPDCVVAIADYGVSDAPAISDSTIGVHVCCRWSGEDPRPVKDLADAVFELWHGAINLQLSTGIWIVQLLRHNGPLSLAQDDLKRWRNAQNFYADVHRPSANRT